MKNDDTKVEAQEALSTQNVSTAPHTASETPKQTSSLATPIAILLAGVLIAGAVLTSANSTPSTGGRILEAEVLPVTSDDHVYGSRSADIFLIEYSDYRCGYCGIFHDTVKKVLETYDGKVAWVYRHTPFQPGGYEAAHASECIAELAGEDAFWKYTELALANQKELGTEWSNKTAQELGAEAGAFKECMDSDRYKELITSHMSNMQDIGGQGTPFSVIMTRKGDMIKISGAQPLDTVVLSIERALKSL
jgi:protein-disulfide isomerase